MSIIKGTDHFDDEWVIHNGTQWVFVGIDFRVAQANEFWFTLLKLCDGPWDVLFPDEITAQAKAMGQPMLPYAWLYSTKWHSINKQVDKWYPILKNYKAIVIDFEDFLSQDFPTGADLWGAISRLKQLGYQGKIIVYTRKGYWFEFASSDPAWLEMVDYLWLADLYGDLEVPAPFSIEHVILRQINWKLDPDLCGISEQVILSGCDENVWLGSAELFEELFGGAIVVPPIEPPIGGTMQVTALTGVNIRQDHSAASADLGDFMTGQTAEVSELWEKGTVKGVDYEQWAHIPAGWIAVYYRNLGSTGKLCTLTGTLPETPVVGKLPVIHLHAEGYPDQTWSPL